MSELHAQDPVVVRRRSSFSRDPLASLGMTALNTLHNLCADERSKIFWIIFKSLIFELGRNPCVFMNY